jgi:putative oxidoreductase
MSNSKFTRIIGIILGAFLIIYAANQFIHFFPTSYGQMPDFAKNYLDAVVSFLPALYIFEILVGIFLLLNIWIPFIAIMLTPLSVSFLIFNFTNGDWNMLTAAFVAVLNLILIYQYWEKYRPLFKS